MRKDALLKELSAALADGRLTKADIARLSDQPKPEPKESHKSTIGRVFAYIGGGIVYIAIAIFIAQNWEIIGSATQLFLTLGAGMAAFVSGVLLSRHESSKEIAPTMYMIAAPTLPIGIFVAFNLAGIDVFASGTHVLVAGIAFAAYLAAALVLRTTILTLFAVLFGTWLYGATGYYLGTVSSIFTGSDYYLYLMLTTGLAYCLLAYSLQLLRGFLYSFGILAVLLSTLVLGVDGASQQVWDFAYILILAATLLLSVYLRSKAFLVFGSLFTVIFIFKVTSEYFADTLGWPFALALIGMSLIGLSFLVINLRKRL